MYRFGKIAHRGACSIFDFCNFSPRHPRNFYLVNHAISLRHPRNFSLLHPRVGGDLVRNGLYAVSSRSQRTEFSNGSSLHSSFFRVIKVPEWVRDELHRRNSQKISVDRLLIMWCADGIHPVFNEKSEKKWNFFTITPWLFPWKFYNWLHPRTRRRKRRRTRRKPARLSGILKESEMCLVTAQENFLEVYLRKTGQTI